MLMTQYQTYFIGSFVGFSFLLSQNKVSKNYRIVVFSQKNNNINNTLYQEQRKMFKALTSATGNSISVWGTTHCKH